MRPVPKLLLAAALCLSASAAVAQQTPVYCINSSSTQCSQSSQVGTGTQGDPNWMAFGKLDAWGAQLSLFSNSTANEVLATPNGSTGIPGLRALVAADLPSTIAYTGSTLTWTASQTFGQVQGATNVQSGTTYTTASTDCGKTLVFTSSSAVTVTIAASIVPASGTACIMSVVQGGTAKVTVTGTAVTAATLESSSSFTGTSGTQWSVITLTLTTVSSTTVAILTGNGS